jgi:hypothetical protein
LPNIGANCLSKFPGEAPALPLDAAFWTAALHSAGEGPVPGEKHRRGCQEKALMLRESLDDRTSQALQQLTSATRRLAELKTSSRQRPRAVPMDRSALLRRSFDTQP